jgi:hypothetical protein
MLSRRPVHTPLGILPPHKLLERAVHVEGERFEPCKLCPLGVLYRLEQPGVQTHLLANLGHEARALG